MAQCLRRFKPCRPHSMQKNQKDLKEIIGALREVVEKYKNYVIIVEGKKDRLALECLGFSNVVILNKPLYEVAEDINATRVVLLTDLDKKGRELYSKIKKDLDKRGILVDDTIRNLLFKTELRQIEGLTKYLKKFS